MISGILYVKIILELEVKFYNNLLFCLFLFRNNLRIMFFVDILFVYN